MCSFPTKQTVTNPPTRTPLGLVIGEDSHSRKVSHLLRGQQSTSYEVRSFARISDALQALRESPAPVAFMTIVVGEDTPSADSTLRPYIELPEFLDTRIMVLCTALSISGVAWLTDVGRLDWVGYAPELQVEAFLESIDAQVSRYLDHKLDVSSQRVASVFDQPFTEAEIIEKILHRVELVLGKQPRITVPTGTKLTILGQWVEEVMIVLDGSVALIHETPSGQIIMHEESTGPIIGLLAVSQGRRAFLTAVTTSEVTGVRLTTEQLNSAIDGHPDIGLLVAMLFIRSLDRRLRRAEELHITNAELSEQLAIERTRLEKALANLEEARTELMAHERLASLGALSAGVAHELNNPMAAIQRIAEYLAEDVSALLTSAPDAKWTQFALTALQEGLNSQALSTRAERELRRDLTDITGDPTVAQRLTMSGIRDPKLAAQLRKRSGISLEAAERAASIGTQLRNLGSASTRITDLVSSLRSYARPDGDPVTEVDLHQNLDDAIRLLSHKLHGIEVIRDYADIPRIECHPGQFAQVWTNLLTNAAEGIAEASEGPDARPGVIKVRTSRLMDQWVRIELIDNGPGIPDHILPHIFEPRFTTKSGQVRFGMGIGMGVARSIVGNHHGTMRIDTSAAGTSVIVDIPIAAPKEEE